MSWIRIDDHAPRHPKMLNAGPLACWLWVCGLAYCSEHLTDGEIPLAALGTFNVPGPARHADLLVDAGLWERTANGYRVHDYHEYQPSRSQVQTRRQQAVNRMATWRKQHGYAHGDAPVTRVTEAQQDGNIAGSSHRPIPVPVPIPIKDVRTARAMRSPTEVPEGFDVFWTAYPKKAAKVDAVKAWKRLRPDATLQTLMLAAIDSAAISDEWTREGGRFIPNAATWLNGHRWEDALTPASSRAPSGRGRASPMPTYDTHDWCYHEPRCPSREYHAVRERDEVEV